MHLRSRKVGFWAMRGGLENASHGSKTRAGGTKRRSQSRPLSAKAPTTCFRAMRRVFEASAHGPFFRSGGANVAFRLRHQKRSAEPQWWFMAIRLFSMPLVICSKMIWHYLKSNLNFNEQNPLRTFFATNIDIIRKAIDVGYCNFYQTSSCCTTQYGTYSYPCGQ